MHGSGAKVCGPFTNGILVGEALARLRAQVSIATKFVWDIGARTGQRTGGLNSRPGIPGTTKLPRPEENQLTPGYLREIARAAAKV